MKPRKTPPTATTDALALLEQLGAGDARMRRLLAEESAKARVAREVQQLRLSAGLEQADLARRTRIPLGVLRQLEEADFEGDSLALLERLAGALGRRVEIRLKPAKRTLQAA